MNSVNLIGRITKDPELRTSANGKVFVGFTIAVNEYSKGNQFTQFIPCFAWEKVAENLVRFVKKGALISIEGSIVVRQENNGSQYSQSVTVRANRIEFLSNQSKGENGEFVKNPFEPTLTNKDDVKNFEFENNDSDIGDDSILWED